MKSCHEKGVTIFQPKFETNQLGSDGSGGTQSLEKETKESCEKFGFNWRKTWKSGIVTEINLWGDILGQH